MSFWKYLIPVLVILLVVACEREIEIDLPNNQNLIVVEGSIEAGQAPVILITRNRGFFESFPTDLQSFVEEFVIQDAEVIISDGIQTETLELTLDFVNYPFFYYTGNLITGQAGRTYSLEIRAEGQLLTSSTTIPGTVSIDSSWFELNPFDVNEDSLGVSFVSIMDPDTFGNAYRMFAKRNSETTFFPVPGSSFNDDFVNGQRVTFFSGRSEQPFATTIGFDPDEFFYKLEDTIFLKFATIGRKEYDFYSTLDAAINSNGNPFASPTLVQSNISGGLGVWVGMSVTFDTTIATN
ncbi:MAG: DUF4249 domain-containing protein [Bacteroidia bacterium]